MRPLRSWIPIALLVSSLGAQEFDTWIGYDVSVYPEAIFPATMEVGDLDGDGRDDVVVAHRVTPRLTVLRNLGGGRYASPLHYTIAAPSYGLALADVDQDGDLDVITADSGSVWQGLTISVHPNQGDGALAAATAYPALEGPAGIVTDDFDGDGALDVAVAGWDGSFGNQVAVLFGDGSGGFQAPQLYTVGNSPYGLASGDLDADGLPELLIGRSGGFLSRLGNNGGTLGGLTQYTIHNLPLAGDFFPSVHVADADLDGDRDVFYTSTKTVMGTDPSAGAMVVLENDGSGALTNLVRHPLVHWLGGGADSALSDLDGDGLLDILTVHRSAGGWTYMHANPAGGYGPGIEVPSGEGPVAIRASDADGDGQLDVLVLNWESLELTVHLNQGNGHFQVHHGPHLVGLATDMDVGDVDGDGDLDVATSGGYAGSGHVEITLNDGAGTFGPPIQAGSGEAALAVKLRDLDGDGDLDLLWADHPTSFPYDFWTATNDGYGNFQQPVEWLVNSCGNGDIDAFDIDHDGDLDVLMTEWLGCAGVNPARCMIRPNLGNGSFGAPYSYTLVLRPHKIAHGDLDLDGHVDVVFSDTGGVSIGFGRGDGTFEPPLQLSLPGGGGGGVGIGDLDSDGLPDVVASRAYGGPGAWLATFRGLGNRSFGAAVGYQGSYSSDLANAQDLILADVDTDGALDVLVLNGGSSDCSYFRNLGNGTLESQVRYGLGPGPSAFAFEDADSDGAPELLALVGLPPTNLGRELVVVQRPGSSEIGQSYCLAAANSTGSAASLSASGNLQALQNDLRLTVHELPVGQFGYFLTSQTQGFLQQPGGSQGNLCLAGQIGRFSGQVQSSGAAGTFSISVDLTSLPTTPPHAVVAGETWNFQAWYRDSNPGPTSNFSAGRSISFQ